MEPVTLAAIGTVALTEGIKFLYAQAGELLKWRRERRERREKAPPIAPEAEKALSGQLEPREVDEDALERLEADIRSLRAHLADYAQGLEDVDAANEDVVANADALRRGLEVVLRQRITFNGEDRPASGPLVKGDVDVDEVAGYVAAVRARTIRSGQVDASVNARRVESGGEAVAIDVDDIG